MGLTDSPSKWYIDSWCVLDGIAFASRRPPRGSDSAALPDPETSVLIAPPDWRAVSISRLSTAMAAARGPFQDGVLDDDDQEIAFPSLDAVRRVVRRAYLAGGLGLDTTGNLEPIEPPPEGPAPRGGALAWILLWKELLGVWAVGDRAQMAPRLFDAIGTEAAHKHYLLNTLRHVSDAASAWQDHHPRLNRRDWEAWLSLGQVYALLEGLEGWYFRRDPFPAHPHQIPRLGPRIGLLFRLPSIGAGHPNFPELPTLGDQLLLSMASRRYLGDVPPYERFVPLVLAALVLASAANPTPVPGSGIDFEEVVQPAVDWLVDALPEPREDGDEIIEEMLERLVVDIAHHRLEPPRTRSSSGSSQPPPLDPSGLPGETTKPRPRRRVLFDDEEFLHETMRPDEPGRQYENES